MSQDDTLQAHLLPPSFAVYMPGAAFIPVLVQPNEENSSSVEVWVAPLLIGPNTVRIHWCLVLMGNDPALRLELDENPVVFFTPNGLIIRGGDQLSMSKTQVALANFKIAEEITHYDINFSIVRNGVPGGVIKAMVKADPVISVTPDPVEIPNWP